MVTVLKSKRGSTLIETLLYLSIVSILIGAISAFYYSMYQASVKAEVVNRVELEGAYVLDYVLREIQNSNSISNPTIGGSGASLNLISSVPTKNPTVFDLSGGRLRVSEGVNAPIFLSSEGVVVSNLDFKNLSYSSSAGAVRASFTLTYINSSGRNEQDYQRDFCGTAVVRK